MKNPYNKVLVIGSGPIVIGQAAEFDYAGTQACKSLEEENIKTILVNSNPATIMTDEETADRVYIEPLSVDVISQIIEKEQPDTNYDLGSKLATFEVKPFNDVLIEFDASLLTNTNFQNIFLNLPFILEESGEPDSDFILDIFKIKTKTLDNQVDTLVNSVCK